MSRLKAHLNVETFFFLELNIQSKMHKGKDQHIPPKKVRTDSIVHWSVFTKKRTRCKFPGMDLQIICEKYDIILCFNEINVHQ